jgi:type II secretory pathway pseudopilin PulG
MLNKKGAMFGLDARIALAIFGALSVISGAALYSAIKQAKVTSVITEAREITKAIEAYYLDTGEMLTHSSSNDTRDLAAIPLKVKPANVTNWNGPYFPSDNDASEYFVSDVLNISITLPYRLSGDWPDTSSTNTTCRKNSTSCHVFIWYSMSDLAMKHALEEAIDGNVTSATEELTGNFRFYTGGAFIKTSVTYKPEWASTS